ncbi:TPA: hypothetical protein ACQZJR_005706, partial [Klebsiella pneumoniae]
KGWDARKRAYCLKIQPATGSFARNLIYSTKPFSTGIGVSGKLICFFGKSLERISLDKLGGNKKG